MKLDSKTLSILKEYVEDNLSRLTILKSLCTARVKSAKTSALIDTVIYSLSRCLLQDSIVAANKLSITEPEAKNFYSKYKDTRDFHSHRFESTKKPSTLLYSDIESIFNLVCTSINAYYNPEEDIILTQELIAFLNKY